jgi:uncharacterized protein (TIGR03118 family)
MKSMTWSAACDSNVRLRSFGAFPQSVHPVDVVIAPRPATRAGFAAFAFQFIRPTLAVVLGGAGTLGSSPAAFAQHRYAQTNLVSDVPGLAAVTDAGLVNAWGLARSGTSPWWVADNGTGLSTLYTGLGVKQALTVTVPPAAGLTGPSTPTGTVFNGSSDFAVGTNQPARFLFATEEGTISGWNPAANPTTAINKVNESGLAVYKGLALGQIGGVNHLYAANFHTGTVDVFDKTFNPVDLGPTAFRDPLLPPGYAPFNVQAIGDKIFVTFAKQDAEKIGEVAGRGRGYVASFTTSGELSLRLRWGPWFNAPWGVAMAPADYGRFSNLILVGQFGSGKIAGFDPVTGKFRGLMRGSNHRTLRIEGLWALAFGNGANAGPLNSLYFTAGIDGEAHGLFGTITSLPDPAGSGKHDDDDDDDHDDD